MTNATSLYSVLLSHLSFVFMFNVITSTPPHKVDIFRTVTLPLLKHFGIEDDLELKASLGYEIIFTINIENMKRMRKATLLLTTTRQIKKRGAMPKGGGEVVFRCPVVRTLKPCNLIDPGKITKIRGIV